MLDFNKFMLVSGYWLTKLLHSVDHGLLHPLLPVLPLPLLHVPQVKRHGLHALPYGARLTWHGTGSYARCSVRKSK
jgi:hypothetical protein